MRYEASRVLPGVLIHRVLIQLRSSQAVAKSMRIWLQHDQSKKNSGSQSIIHSLRYDSGMRVAARFQNEQIRSTGTHAAMRPSFSPVAVRSAKCAPNDAPATTKREIQRPHSRCPETSAQRRSSTAAKTVSKSSRSRMPLRFSAIP